MAVDHCYSDIGCFPLSEEFYHPRHRPFNVRPWHRRRIGTQFELYSRHHPDGYILQPWNRINLIGSRFNPLLETKIIIPGWLDNIRRALWVRKLKDSLLWLWKPVNIIVVHWRNFTPYTIATANTRVVGAELANLLKSIEYELRYNRAHYHLIGHSLGAHIGGYCGDRMPGLGRITALDPARPFFQHMPKSVRLDRADARFVDAIHSDFTPENAIFLLMSFGMTTPVGHLDFYPNGPPLLQPGCLRDSLLSVQNGIQRGLEHSSLSIAFLESIRYLTACDHQRSHEWFIESITNRQCVFVGVRCDQFEGLINGRCTCDSSPSACAIMGIHADQMYVNNLHEDMWPLQAKRNKPAPGINRPHPSMSPALGRLKGTNPVYHQLGRPSTKSQMYGQMKQHAIHLRHPPEPDLLDELQLDDLDSLRDDALIEYFRFNLLTAPEAQLAPPIQRPDANLNMAMRRSSSELAEDEFHTLFEGIHVENNHYGAFDGHPKLLSDVDRDIESWYEDSSRWFLKTNNRPNYCANQYQVLVFIGPLKTTTGHRHVRANLILSVIGTKGQLMNQRFVPRSSNIDSFTMQPFFILLEGSYSLGDILSVAIGWEARLDPDPIQATISFQNNLLEEIQSVIPTYQARHPWLSETLKYDHSAGFQWHPPSVASELLPNVGIELETSKRADHDRGQQAPQKIERRSLAPGLSNHLDPGCPHPDGNLELDQCSVAALVQHEQMEMASSSPIDELLSGEGVLAENDYIDDLLEPESNPKQNVNYRRPKEEPFLSFEDNNPDTKASHQAPINEQIANHETLLNAESQITAKLHNIGVNLDRDYEDSIVVNQVVVSAVQANYGKTGTKVAKTFCPPSPNYRLGRDITVKLVANLVGNCRYMNSHYVQNRPISRPVMSL